MKITLSVSVLCSFGLLSVQGAFANVIKVERQIQLPNGKPAAGAKIVLRAFDPATGIVQREKQVVTGEDGIVRAEIEAEPEASMNPVSTSGYMVVDVPGMALTFEKFSNQYPLSYHPAPLILGPGYQLKGRVVGPNGKPVANAEVLLAGFNTLMQGGYNALVGRWPINWPANKLVLPEAKTTSGADGSFQLRPVQFVDRSIDPNLREHQLFIIARSTKGRPDLIGSDELVARRVDAPLDQAVQLPENSLVLSPAATIRGRAINAVDGRPVAGVQMRLRSSPANAIAALTSPIMTRADGRFEWKGVPNTSPLSVEANHANLGAALLPLGGAPVQEDHGKEVLYDNLELKMRPMVQVSGRVSVTDAGGIRAPLTVVAVYEQGIRGIGRGYASTLVNPDGTFSLRTAVGTNSFGVSGPGYKPDRATPSVILDVKPEGNPEVSLSVRPERGYLVHFTSEAAKGQANFDFDREYDLFYRNEDGQAVSVLWNEWWYFPLYAPNETLEIRVTRSVDGKDQEVLPWTKLTPRKEGPIDSEDWPRVINLPLT